MSRVPHQPFESPEAVEVPSHKVLSHKIFRPHTFWAVHSLARARDRGFPEPHAPPLICLGNPLYLVPPSVSQITDQTSLPTIAGSQACTANTDSASKLCYRKTEFLLRRILADYEPNAESWRLGDRFDFFCNFLLPRIALPPILHSLHCGEKGRVTLDTKRILSLHLLDPPSVL